LRAVTEPSTFTDADSGSCFNSNAYLNIDTDTQPNPNVGGYLNSDARFDSDPNAGAYFKSIDHAGTEPCVTIANRLAAGDYARRIAYVQGGAGPGTGDSASAGLLQRERGQHLWPRDSRGYPSLPEQHRRQDDGAIDCWGGQPFGQHTLIAFGRTLRRNALPFSRIVGAVLIKVFSISQGTLNEALAHPREVFKPVIAFSAFAFIMVHNHPSGDPSLSEADLQLTRRIVEASKVLQLPIDRPRHHRLAGSGARELLQLSRREASLHDTF
jgi:hypothetical protein